MANKVNVTIDALVTGYVQGVKQATDAGKAYETETRKIADSQINLMKELKAAKKEAQNLAAGYAKLDETAKNSQFGKEMSRQLNEASEKASSFINLQGDIKDGLNSLASETTSLDMLSTGIGALGGAASSAAGLIALFTGNEKDAQRAVVMFTTAQSALNTIISTYNAIKKIQNVLLVKGTTYTTANTVAQNLNTAAKTKNTIATTSATTAQKLFNTVAKANPYVLLATAVVGVTTALWAFAKGSDNAKKEQEALNKEVEEGKKKKAEYEKELNNVYVTTATKLQTSFVKLQAIWKDLHTEVQKKQFIKDYASELKGLGVEINNIVDAENLFVNNTDKFAKAIELRARMAVLQRKLEKAVENDMKTRAKDPNRTTHNIYEGIAIYISEEIANLQKEINDTMKTFKSSIPRTSTNTSKPSKPTNPSKIDNKEEIKSIDEAVKKYDALIKRQEELIALKDKMRIAPENMGQVALELEGIAHQLKEIEDKWGVLPIKIEINTDETKVKIAKLFEEISKKLAQSKQRNMFSFIDDEDMRDNAFNALAKLEAIDEARNELYDMRKDASEAELSMIDSAEQRLNSLYDTTHELVSAYTQVGIAGKKVYDINMKIAQASTTVGTAFEYMGSALSGWGDAFDSVELQAAQMIAQAVATLALSFAEAAKNAAMTPGTGWLQWLAFGLTGLGTLGTMIAQVKSLAGYANGGIVGGSSYYGDNMLIRANSGEMILNQQQQRNLFNMLDQGSFNPTSHVQVTGVIRGTDIMLVQKNTNKSLGRAGSAITF